MKYISILLLVAVAATGCTHKKEESNKKKSGTEELEPQVVSLLGITYFEPNREPETQKRLEDNLKEARRRFKEDPTEMNYIWFGRRMAYLSRYIEAIEIYSEALEKYPDSYELYRHRGHRYISIRDFDRAIEDLQKAADLMPRDTLMIEPDGIPNTLNKPLSSTQFNVWYHLALAHYLKGDFKKAERAYQRCMETSVNDDLLCATSDWLYMTYRRQSKDALADSILKPISVDMNIIENASYHKRLLMYKGQIAPDSLLKVGNENPDPDLALATQGYGVGNWYLYNGDSTKAFEIFEKVVAGKHWSAFGFIAAEVEVARKRKQN